MSASTTIGFDDPLLSEAWAARRRAGRQRAMLALCVSASITLAWLAAVTMLGLWPRVIGQWPASLTMVFGSIVAGSTPQGGGAVAFPVFTKVLGVPAEVARSFSLCIQTVGMGAATLAIIINRRPVEWRTVAITTGAAVVGFLVMAFLASDPSRPFRPSLLPGPYVKVTFTIVLVSMAFVVFSGTRVSLREVHRVLPALNGRMIATYLVIGLIGGASSALVGSGADVFVYLAMVVFFTVDPKVGVPTSVVCMAAISVLGFITFGFVDRQLFVGLNDAGEVVQLGGAAVTQVGAGQLAFGDGPGGAPRQFDLFGLWLAAVPIVCWGAPLGSWLASRMTTRRLVQFVTLLALAEVISTAIFLEDLRTDRVLLVYAILGTGLTLGLLWLIARYRARLFRLPDVNLDASLNAERIDVAEDYRARGGAR
ncbi:TSUP family transporter [Rhodobacterales bacterium HKCCE2091]|nr:TSUP family transporter [Rhodobacterales bacterium HKCCE2091]